MGTSGLSMRSGHLLTRIVTLLALLSAYVVLISALFEPLLSLTFAGACSCFGIACCMYRCRPK